MRPVCPIAPIIKSATNRNGCVIVFARTTEVTRVNIARWRSLAYKIVTTDSINIVSGNVNAYTAPKTNINTAVIHDRMKPPRAFENESAIFLARKLNHIQAPIARIKEIGMPKIIMMKVKPLDDVVLDFQMSAFTTKSSASTVTW